MNFSSFLNSVNCSIVTFGALRQSICTFMSLFRSKLSKFQKSVSEIWFNLQYLNRDLRAQMAAFSSEVSASVGSLSARVRLWLAYLMMGAKVLSKFLQKLIEKASGEDSSVSSLLIYRMVARSVCFRKDKYSFSQRTEYSFMVRCVVQYFFDSLKLSQFFRLNQLCFSSARFLISFCRCLQSIRVILLKLLAPTRRWQRFRVRQQIKRQQWSWLMSMWLLRVYCLPSMGLSLLPGRLWPRVKFDVLFSNISQPNSLWLLQSTTFAAHFLYSGFSLSFLSFNAMNSSLLVLFSGSIAHSFSKIFLTEADILCLSDNEYGKLVIFLMSSFSFLHSHGVIPVSNSQKMTPIEKISLRGEQTFFTRASSGIQRGVPTLYFVLISPSEQMAKPKSAIFQFLRLFSMLAGLRSRCRMPFESRYLTPSMIQVITSAATASWSFPRRARQVRRSPLEQYSVTMQQCVGVLWTSKHLITLGWSRVFRI